VSPAIVTSAFGYFKPDTIAAARAFFALTSEQAAALVEGTEAMHSALRS